jgi:hypothetical protein
MADLVSLQDITELTGVSYDPNQITRINSLIKGASARVRKFLGRELTKGTYAFQTRDLIGNHLPETPVESITSAKDFNNVDVLYYWDGLEVIDLYRSGYETVEYITMNPIIASFIVTYVGGYAVIPDDIKHVVMSMVLRAYGVDPTDGGKTGESIQGYSYQTGMIGAAGPSGMLPEEMATLQVYKTRAKVVGIGSFGMSF